MNTEQTSKKKKYLYVKSFMTSVVKSAEFIFDIAEKVRQ